VSEQNLLPDGENGPVRHPKIGEVFAQPPMDGCYAPKPGEGGVPVWN
jgi:heat shock protein HspQ